MTKKLTDNPLKITYINKIENKVTFKTKTGCYHELLTLQMMKLLGSTKNKITKEKNGENVPYLKITEVVLIHFNTVNNEYQHDLRVLYKIVSNTMFGRLLYISPKSFIFLKIFNSEFSYIKVWFTDQNFKQLDTEDEIEITLVIH